MGQIRCSVTPNAQNGLVLGRLAPLVAAVRTRLTAEVRQTLVM